MLLSLVSSGGYYNNTLHVACRETERLRENFKTNRTVLPLRRCLLSTARNALYETALPAGVTRERPISLALGTATYPTPDPGFYTLRVSADVLSLLVILVNCIHENSDVYAVLVLR